MTKQARIIAIVLGLISAGTSQGERPWPCRGGADVLQGGLVGAGKAARDTIYLLGGPGRLDGKFQNASGIPNWQGWTHIDATAPGAPKWHVSSFNSPTGTPAIWCGQESFPNACGLGYGNNWRDALVFTHAVANPGVSTDVNLQFVFNGDSEENFDFLRVQANRGGDWQDIVTPYDGLHLATAVDAQVTFAPGDYVGSASDQLQLRLLGTSDDASSDEDCFYDSNGLAQVDDIRVTIGQLIILEDFNDGTSHYWTPPTAVVGCGDFAAIWSGLYDIDPCASNQSPQVAFIDDGFVVPGTGGTNCVSWCYGPEGYIVNNTGGLAGPESHLDNLLISPALTWPAGQDGAILTFDVYAHEDLVPGVSPGIFYKWHVRSATSLEGLASAPWRNRNLVGWASGLYRSEVQPVTDLLQPERTYVQVALRCIEYGWFWGYEGADGTPAPYFDNVAFKVFPFAGPSVTARAIDLAQDNFPEQGELDPANLANNWVRFDMARSIAADAHLRNDPGDSIVVDIGLPRAGSLLDDMPKLVVKMKSNPVFDSVRVLPTHFTRTGEIVDGWVYGDSTRQVNGTPVPNRYNFDLPDSNFFFPGDVIHYYIEAKDNFAGDIGTTTLPADLTFLAEFRYANTYSERFTVRALPSVLGSVVYQPEILFWNDAAGGGDDDAWYDAFAGCYYVTPGVDFDIYETNGPSSGVGNGLGGRATSDLLSGYEVLVYTCGDLGTFTLGNGDSNFDPADDLAVLIAWFAQGGKHAFMTGDDLAESLGSGAASVFRHDFLGVDLVSGNIRPLIGNQIAPRVQAVAGNSITLPADAAWIASGGCPGIKDFDAVVPVAGAEILAHFCNPSGHPAYPYAGAWRYTDVGDVVGLPYDLAAVSNAPDWTPPHHPPARTWLLDSVLWAFGQGMIPYPAVPDAGVLTVSAYPNPFNPRTTITLDLPRAGEATLRLYDIRGRLVRTLHEGPLTEGRHDLTWAGADDAGRAVASGVYFFELKVLGEERIGKLTLIR